MSRRNMPCFSLNKHLTWITENRLLLSFIIKYEFMRQNNNATDLAVQGAAMIYFDADLGFSFYFRYVNYKTRFNLFVFLKY